MTAVGHGEPGGLKHQVHPPPRLKEASDAPLERLTWKNPAVRLAGVLSQGQRLGWASALPHRPALGWYALAANA